MPGGIMGSSKANVANLIAMADGCYSDLQHLRSLLQQQQHLVERGLAATASLRDKLMGGNIDLQEATSTIQAVQSQLDSQCVDSHRLALRTASPCAFSYCPPARTLIANSRSHLP